MSIYWQSRILAIIVVSLVIGAQLTAAQAFRTDTGHPPIHTDRAPV